MGCQLREYIGRAYIDRIVNYIRGTSPKIVTSKEYMRLYNFIVE